MDTRVKVTPVSAREHEQLGEFLGQLTNPGALSLEGIDGLFCALIAGPSWVTPSQYLPLLLGGSLSDEFVTFNVARVNAVFGLFIRHWNSILGELDRGAVYPPHIAHGCNGTIPGRAWAQGFMRGVYFVQGDGWNELLQDKAASELYRIPHLVRETDPAAVRETSAETLPWLALAVADAYQHFLDRRIADRLIVELNADVASRWRNSADRS